jgi:hypothetical protein
MNTPVDTIRFFRGTLAEVEAAETIDKMFYLATDTKEIFVGNAAGKKIQYSGGTYKTNNEIVQLIKDYNTENVANLQSQITALKNGVDASLTTESAAATYATKSELTTAIGEVGLIEKTLFSGSAANGFIDSITLPRASLSDRNSIRIIFMLSADADASGKYNYFSVTAPVGLLTDASKQNVIHCACNCIGEYASEENPTSLYLMDAQVYWNNGLWVKIWKSAIGSGSITAPEYVFPTIISVVGVK